MSTYKKPWLSFDEQVKLLKSRSLNITNDNVAKDYLKRIGYYRLSAYWYPFRKQKPEGYREDNFIDHSNFKDVIALYVYDKKFRLLLLDGIERIEVSLRVELSHELGRIDPFAHRKPELLHNNFTQKKSKKNDATNYEIWLKKLEQTIKRSKDDFTKHYKKKYDLPLPIWVSVELWDFGLLSHFYQGLKVKDKLTIAKKYNIPSGEKNENWILMESWLRSINYIRNVAAHHSRLWNKSIVDQPKLPGKDLLRTFGYSSSASASTSKIYLVLCILLHFIKQVCPSSSWPQRLKKFILAFPNTPGLSIKNMGFPQNWDKQDVWNNSPAKPPPMAV